MLYSDVSTDKTSQSSSSTSISPSSATSPSFSTSSKSKIGSKMADRGDKSLISYQIMPKPPPEPLPFPIRFFLMVCCGGNMKYVVFPTLMAVSLGLFLAFSKAVATTNTSRGYSHYQNSRQLSEDDVNYFPRGHTLFGNMLKDHGHVLQGGNIQQQQLTPEEENGCDCSRCDVDTSFIGTNPKQLKRLVKHSFQHFYGHQDLALQIEAFVPNKKKQWDLSPAFYVTASHVCGDDDIPLAIVLVHTHHRHFSERSAIRDTWGSVTKGNDWPHRQLPGDVKLIFVLEVSEDPIDNDLANKEATGHGDIVLVDVQETRHPATRKMLAGFKWVTQFCPKATFLIKVEEKTFLDLPLLLNLLSNQDMTNMIVGPIIYADTVIRETSEHKLLVSKSAYFPDYYPPYAMGDLYAMPVTLMKRILGIAEFLPHVSVEDAFISGIVAKVFDVRHINLPDWLFDRTPDRKPELCDFVYRKKMAARNVSPGLARSLWRRIEKAEMCGL